MTAAMWFFSGLIVGAAIGFLAASLLELADLRRLERELLDYRRKWGIEI